MKYTAKTAETIAERLRELPEVARNDRHLNKREIVKLLASEIEALQKRGYSTEEIAEHIRQGGLDISTQTLKNYIQRTRRERSAKRGANKRHERAKGVPAMPPPARGAPGAPPAPARQEIDDDDDTHPGATNPGERAAKGAGQ